MTLKKRACVSVHTHVGDGEPKPGDGGLPDDPPPMRPHPPPSPSSQPASSPGPGLCGHLPLLMKIHGLISISGVISDTAKHKTGLFPLQPGERIE